MPGAARRARDPSLSGSAGAGGSARPQPRSGRAVRAAAASRRGPPRGRAPGRRSCGRTPPPRPAPLRARVPSRPARRGASPRRGQAPRSGPSVPPSRPGRGCPPATARHAQRRRAAPRPGRRQPRVAPAAHRSSRRPSPAPPPSACAPRLAVHPAPSVVRRRVSHRAVVRAARQSVRVPTQRTLVVFGASGAVGREVVAAALKAGWVVRGFTRDASRLDRLHSRTVAAADLAAFMVEEIDRRDYVRGAPFVSG